MTIQDTRWKVLVPIFENRLSGLGLGLGLPFGVVLLASSCSLIGCVELEAPEVSGMAELDVTGHRFAMNDWYL